MHPHGGRQNNYRGSGEEIISPSGEGVRRMGRSMHLRVSRPYTSTEPSRAREEGDHIIIKERGGRWAFGTSASRHCSFGTSGRSMQIRVSMRDGCTEAGVEGRGSTANASYQRALFGAQSTTIVCRVEKSKRTIGGRKGMRARGEEIEDTDEIPWKGWQEHPR